MYAVEPSGEMRASIDESAPRARRVEAALEPAVIPEPLDFGWLDPVLYHVREADWGRLVLECASGLSDAGVLCIALKHPTAGCGDLMEHFGAPRFDPYSLLRSFRN
jgi:hypothetical protein